MTFSGLQLLTNFDTSDVGFDFYIIEILKLYFVSRAVKIVSSHHA